jgi:hypothetical protein
MSKSEIQVQHLINQLVKLIEDTKVNKTIKLKKADA